MDEAFSFWWNSVGHKSLRMMTLIVSWGIWIARNECIFNDTHRSILEIMAKAVGLIVFFSDTEALPQHRLCPSVQIDENMPWAFFDGVAGGDPIRCGGGIMLQFDGHNYIHFSAGFGTETNNFAETSSLRFLLTKALEWGIHSIHIFGDSKLTIDWAAGTHQCSIIHLRPIMNDIFLIKQHFNFVSFTHFYRERNVTTDHLSKVGAQLEEGEETTETFLREEGIFCHRPFNEDMQ